MLNQFILKKKMINYTNKIAIKGDKTNGKEIIDTLKMLGGINRFKLDGSRCDLYYYINNNYTIDVFNDDSNSFHCFKIMTIDEFYVKYPFKVGEKVKSYFGDWHTRIIEAKEIDGEVRYRVTNAGIYYFQKACNFEKCRQNDFSSQELEITIHILKSLQEQYKNTNELAYNAFSPIILEVINQLKKQK